MPPPIRNDDDARHESVRRRLRWRSWPQSAWADYAALTAIFCALACICYPYLDFVPFYDAGWYLNCVLQASSNGRFNMDGLVCAGHPSFVYLFLLALTQRIDHGRIELIHCANLGLFMVSILAFHALLSQIFRRKELALELRIVTCLYAFMPGILSNLFFLNLDYATMLGAVLMASCLSRGRIYSAALSAFLLAGSKETGAAFYLAILPAFWLYARAKKIRIGRGEIVALLAPGATCAAIYLYFGDLTWRSAYAQEHLNFERGGLSILYEFKLLEPQVISLLANAYLINFNWVFVLSLLGLVASASRALKGRKPLLAGSDPQGLLFCLYLLVAASYIVTLVLSYPHVRYVMLVYPWLIIGGYAGLLSCAPRRNSLRKVLLSATLLCIWASNFRTIDPLSKHILGTFHFGQHEMLRFKQSTKYRLPDQIAYNLQFLMLDRLQIQAFRMIEPNARTVIVACKQQGFHNPLRLRARDFSRTAIAEPGSFPLSFIDEPSPFARLREKIGRGKNQQGEFYFLEFPNCTPRALLQSIKARYPLTSSVKLEQGGYSINIHRFRLPDRKGSPK